MARVFPGMTPQVIRGVRVYEWWAFAQEAKNAIEQERKRSRTNKSLVRGARRGR